MTYMTVLGKNKMRTDKTIMCQDQSVTHHCYQRSVCCCRLQCRPASTSGGPRLTVPPPSAAGPLSTRSESCRRIVGGRNWGCAIHDKGRGEKTLKVRADSSVFFREYVISVFCPCNYHHRPEVTSVDFLAGQSVLGRILIQHQQTGPVFATNNRT